RILFTRDVTTADSEHTLSVEAGLKTVLMDRRLRFNLTAYHFKTKDLQLSAVGGTTNANLLLNADAVKGYGFEAELEARPVHGLSMTAGLSYNHTKIDDEDLTVAACGGPPADTFPDVSRSPVPGRALRCGDHQDRRQFAAAGAEVDVQLPRRIRTSGRARFALHLHRLVP